MSETEVQNEVSSTIQNVEQTAASTEATVKDAVAAAQDTAAEGLNALKKPDGSIDVAKVLREIILPVAVVGGLVCVGLCMKQDEEQESLKESPVKSAISLFRSKKDDTEAALKEVGRELDKTAQKASSEMKSVTNKTVQTTGNIFQKFMDWLGSLGK
eukprot:CAMPEP_0184683636 /NCGR_PEP_ID=MMETSP0312-20130426/11990_1 /TAXON_ID=31354 /ORGANISM="Compsopogon coeruleus, Strain SAG 36.94" /LENGTH=156 /DNA_ID=CAMNT_0027136103 /DNA_START=149 /DNA_END=619 /DNA_ORIENTATION=-